MSIASPIVRRRGVDGPPSRWWLVDVGAVSVLALFVGAMLAGVPGELDRPVRAATHPQIGGLVELAMKGFAVLSMTRVLFIVATLMGIFFAVVSKDWRPGVALVVAVVGASLSADLLKDLFQLPSPEQWEVGAEVGRAFPSAHAAVAVAAWGLIVVLAVRRLRPAFATILGIVGGGMLAGALMSRILLGAHWASDVLAGAGLGGLWFCVGAEICLLWPARNHT